MMEIEIDLRKTVDENAAVYFEKSKKAKRKLEGAEEALKKSIKNLEKVRKKTEEKKKKEQAKENITKRKKEWFEKFRWFYSSDGFLCIGGRDATSNEIIIKKHADKEDIVFHTDMSGSPFFVVKKNSNPGKEISKQTMDEVAQATASFSRAWKNGMSYLEVFHVSPEQVSKKPRQGEYLGKGAFVIYGKTTYHKPKIEIAVGMIEHDGTMVPMCAPESAFGKKSKEAVKLIPGRKKPSEIAKLLAKKFDFHDLDEFIRILPSGNADTKKE